MGYSLYWVREVGFNFGHVDIKLFVSFSFALSTHREHGFWWNMGLSNQQFSQLGCTVLSEIVFALGGFSS